MNWLARSWQVSQSLFSQHRLSDAVQFLNIEELTDCTDDGHVVRVVPLNVGLANGIRCLGLVFKCNDFAQAHPENGLGRVERFFTDPNGVITFTAAPFLLCERTNDPLWQVNGAGGGRRGSGRVLRQSFSSHGSGRNAHAAAD